MARILISLAATCIVGLTSIPTQAADLGAGGTYFHAHCSVCHGNTANAPQSVGPRLFGVVGRHAGTLPGYAYSKSMKQSGLTWTADQLKRYLAKPQAAIPGNKMPFPGITKATDLDNVAAYLETLR